MIGPSSYWLERFTPFACLLALLWSSAAAVGHGGLHEQITTLSARIQSGDFIAADLLKRGELHALHGDYEKALQDCDAAEAKQPDFVDLNLLRGQVLYQANRFEEARRVLDRHLQRVTNSTEAFTTRGRVLMKLGNPDAAGADYLAALRFAQAPDLDLFCESAIALRAANKQKEALEVLDSGIRLIGPIASLQQPAIGLEVSLGNYEGALRRLESLSSKSPRQEYWLKQKGEILEQSGRLTEATLAYEEALRAIAQLPPRHRNTSSVEEAGRDIKRRIARLKAREL